MHAKSEALSQENACYKEQVTLQQKKLFGRSSEKVVVDQISLFGEAGVESTPIADESNKLIICRFFYFFRDTHNITMKESIIIYFM